MIEAADALEEGGVTGLVEGTDGYYVAKVTSLFDEEATSQKKEEIISQRQSEKYNEVLDGWREDAEITVDEKVWAKIDLLHAPEYSGFCCSSRWDTSQEYHPWKCFP